MTNNPTPEQVEKLAIERLDNLFYTAFAANHQASKDYALLKMALKKSVPAEVVERLVEALSSSSHHRYCHYINCRCPDTTENIVLQPEHHGGRCTCGRDEALTAYREWKEGKP